MNKKNILLIALVLILLLLLGAGAYWWFVLRAKPAVPAAVAPAVATPVAEEAQAARRDLIDAATDKAFTFRAFEITVKSLQYSASRVPGYEDTASQDQKLLVLSFTARNSGANPNGLGYITPWSVVDENGKKTPVEMVLDEATHESAAGDVEPDSIHTITAVFLLPAKAKAMAFFLDPNDGTPQIKVKISTPPQGLDPIFADPAEPTGSSVLPRIAAKVGTTYPLSYPFDFSVDAIALSATDVNQSAAAEGKQYLVLNLTFTNTSSKVQSINSGSIGMRLKDADGGAFENSSLVKGSSNDDLAVEIEPGASIKARAFIEAPLKPELASLLIQQPRGSGESRIFTYDLKSLGLTPTAPVQAPAAAEAPVPTNP